MPLITWKPEYSVNDAELDSHHQKLFRIINTVYKNVMTSQKVESILPMLDELSAYTRYHFSAEEQYLRERGFPDIEDHLAKHREFTLQIEVLRTNYNDNDLDVSGDLIVFLGEWLLNHVLKEDRKYSNLSLAAENASPGLVNL